MKAQKNADIPLEGLEQNAQTLITQAAKQDEAAFAQESAIYMHAGRDRVGFVNLRRHTKAPNKNRY
jgi:hypothetical protein